MVIVFALAAAVLYGSADFLGGAATRRQPGTVGGERVRAGWRAGHAARRGRVRGPRYPPPGSAGLLPRACSARSA